MTDRARHWRGLVDAWETSGLSQAAFCRRRGVKAVTFGWWKRRLKGARTLTGEFRGDAGVSMARGCAKIVEHGSAQFVEVALPQTAPVGASISSSAAGDGNAACRSSSDDSAAPGCYEIALNGGRVIRLPSSFEPAVVARLIAVLESC